MADPWIKMRKKLCTDPRVIAAARRCDSTPNEIIGGLFRLWCMADDHGGHLSAFDADTLDDFVRIEGFTNALPNDWIRVESTGIDLPDYDEHNGSTARRRAMEAKRKADARNTSAPDADKKRDRGDKRRVDKKKSKARKRAKFDPDSVEIPDSLEQHEPAIRKWLRYKQERGETYKPTGLDAFFGKCEKKGAQLTNCIEHSMANNWAGLYDAPEQPQTTSQYDIDGLDFTKGRG